MDTNHYKPNWRDPRVRRKAQRILNWCEFSLNEFRPREVSKWVLDEVFGPSGNKLSAFLRAELLTEYSKSYMVGQYSKRYLLNKEGMQRLHKYCGIQVPAAGSAIDAMPFYEKKHGAELATLIFEMRDSSDRLWHPLQNISREKKQQFWTVHGLPFDYDIAACAPTILFQCAVKAGLPAITLEALQRYLDERSEFRMHVGRLAGLPPAESKRLVNSLFNGARLMASNFCTAYREIRDEVARQVLVREDRDMSAPQLGARLHGLRQDANVRTEATRRVRALQQDRDVTLLVKAIRRLWRRLDLIEQHAQQNRKQAVKRNFKTSRQKWGYYFRRERAVLDVIRGHLTRTGNRYFTEHDGFRTEKEVDLPQLQEEILQQTGLRLTIERTQSTAAHAAPAQVMWNTSLETDNGLQSADAKNGIQGIHAFPRLKGERRQAPTTEGGRGTRKCQQRCGLRGAVVVWARRDNLVLPEKWDRHPRVAQARRPSRRSLQNRVRGDHGRGKGVAR